MMTQEEAWTISNNFGINDRKLKDREAQMVCSLFLLSGLSGEEKGKHGMTS